LDSGFLQQLSKSNPDINPVQDTTYHTEQKSLSGNWFTNILDWLKGLPWLNIVIGMVIAFFALLILPFILRRLFRR
jgi:hypothetical protein